MPSSSTPKNWISPPGIGLDSKGKFFKVVKSFRAPKIDAKEGWHIAATGHGDEIVFQAGDIGICYAARSNGNFFLGFEQDRRKPPSPSTIDSPTRFAVCIVCSIADIKRFAIGV